MDRIVDRDREPVEFGRVLALSDGIFAFAMTLLVISIVLPAGLPTAAFPEALGRLMPKVAIMALSIAVVASAWLWHHRLFRMLQRADGRLIGLNLAALGLVALVPFPHQVLGDYPHEPLSYALYAAVLGALNLMTVVIDVHVHRHGLLRVPPSHAQFRREIVRGLVVTGAFGLSIPLAFVLVGLTPLMWLAVLPVENRLSRPAAPARAAPAASPRRAPRAGR